MPTNIIKVTNKNDNFELFAIADELSALLLAYSELSNIKKKRDSSNLFRVLNANFKVLLDSVDTEISNAYDVQRAYKIIND